MNEWKMFHTLGDDQCDACVIPPFACACGGLIHAHFNEELDAVEAHCDQCAVVDHPAMAEVA